MNERDSLEIYPGGRGERKIYRNNAAGSGKIPGALHGAFPRENTTRFFDFPGITFLGLPSAPVMQPRA